MEPCWIFLKDEIEQTKLMSKPMVIVELGHPKAKIVVGGSAQAIEAANILQATIKSISGLYET